MVELLSFQLLKIIVMVSVLTNRLGFECLYFIIDF